LSILIEELQNKFLGYLEYYDDIWPLEFIGIEK
jgi:hypothetical protein